VNGISASPAWPGLGVVVIGRNEARRLDRVLAAVGNAAPRLVYVDSASRDGSREIAEGRGVPVVALTEPPFTAARGRAAGLDWLLARDPGLRWIQFIDGDCVLHEQWIPTAMAYLAEHPRVAAVMGRLREEYASRSTLIRFVDTEWELPEGPSHSLGGIAMIRLDALREVGGWRTELIAGEELDLATRLRAAGWELVRLPNEMCLHDIGITRWRQLWPRFVRTGHSYAQLAWEHGFRRPRWLRRAAGTLFYGLALPLSIPVALALWWPAALVAPAIYALLIARLARARLRRGDSAAFAALYGSIMAIGKPASAFGAMKFGWSLLSRRPSVLIEYKGPHLTAAGPGREIR
jgi:GT2 family glycosyltransferase